MKIGNIELKNKVVIAPLAGISDYVFREQMVEFGAALVYSEMISASGLSRGDAKTKFLMRTTPAEQPVVLQLFGTKPEEYEASVEYLNNHYHTQIAAIDINMGCPVRKVVQSGAGSAMMLDLNNARRVIETVSKFSRFPITVKFRSGWDSTKLNYLDLGKICEDSGVSAVTLHPRTRAQAYTGKADWSHLTKLKQHIAIPVIGSGDIHCWQDAYQMMDQTGCDAVMLGRGVIGNPWLISSILQKQDIVPTYQQRCEAFLGHTKRLMAKYNNNSEAKSVAEMRKFGVRYFTGFNGASQLRQKLNGCHSLAELTEVLQAGV